jgi:hypothetical protein
MAAQYIKNPAAMTRMLAPGFPEVPSTTKAQKPTEAL